MLLNLWIPFRKREESGVGLQPSDLSKPLSMINREGFAADSF